MSQAPERARAPDPGPGISYPYPLAPAAARWETLAPGVLWLRMPLPFALDHINLWLLEDAGGWTLVDTGLANDPIREIWQRLLQDLPGGRPLTRLLVTHFHPDHLGLAGWLQERSGAPLWASASEWLLGSLLYYDADGRSAAQMLTFFGQHGLGEDWRRRMDTGNRYRRLVSPPPTWYHRLRAGDRVQIGGNDWRVLVGRGHSPEHACLYCEALRLLISGDQVLPRITPNISVYASEPEANPLQDYLDSLGELRALPADTLVLPAHGFPFRGLHQRIDFIREHHGDRFADLLGALARPSTAAECVPRLFRRELDPHQMMFAMGETLAHLAFLTGTGEVLRESSADGCFRFVCR